MNAREPIQPPTARPIAAPLSSGMRANGFVFVSGQIATDPETGRPVGEGATPNALDSEARLARPELLVEIEAIALA